MPALATVAVQTVAAAAQAAAGASFDPHRSAPLQAAVETERAVIYWQPGAQVQVHLSLQNNAEVCSLQQVIACLLRAAPEPCSFL